jgi:tripartite-type tricarboxylate transporter receptor subunit TctC
MKASRQTLRVGTALALNMSLAAGVGFAAMTLPTDALAEWQPQRPIEFVIQTSPGGGSDVYARLWIGIIEKYNLSPVPITPVNMPGGAGAVAMTYLFSQAGDPHYITPTLNSLVTTPLQQEIPVMYPSEDLTPIAKMLMDPFWLVTNPSDIGSWEEFLERCQSERLTSVGTGTRQEDEIQIMLLQEAVGCEPFRYVPEGGGGAVASAVAGGHQHFNVNQPAEAIPHHPERLIPIVQFLPERDEVWSEVPTHWELGIGTEKEVTPGVTYAEMLDLESGLHQMRGIIGPPDISDEAKAWYENLFRQVFETEDWQNFMRDNAMSPIFMGPDEYREWLITFENNHVAAMRDIFGWELRPDLRDR